MSAYDSCNRALAEERVPIPTCGQWRTLGETGSASLGLSCWPRERASSGPATGKAPPGPLGGGRRQAPGTPSPKDTVESPEDGRGGGVPWRWKFDKWIESMFCCQPPPLRWMQKNRKALIKWADIMALMSACACPPKLWAVLCRHRFVARASERRFISNRNLSLPEKWAWELEERGA